MTPNYDRAATAAAEILIKYGINKAPVIPTTIFKRAPGFNVVTFAEMSGLIGMDRKDLNRQIRSQFAEYISEFLDFQQYLSKSDHSMLANFGTFMDGYEE